MALVVELYASGNRFRSVGVKLGTIKVVIRRLGDRSLGIELWTKGVNIRPSGVDFRPLRVTLRFQVDFGHQNSILALYLLEEHFGHKNSILGFFDQILGSGG